MVHALSKKQTKLDRFLYDNNVNMKKLEKHIAVTTIANNKAKGLTEYPICYSTIRNIVKKANQTINLEFAIQIRDGLSLYLERPVTLEEIFDI